MAKNDKIGDLARRFLAKAGTAPDANESRVLESVINRRCRERSAEQAGRIGSGPGCGHGIAKNTAG